MSSTRYFKAVHGSRTYFRKTASRAYTHFSVTKYGASFSAVRGDVPAIEITQAEYDQLNALKRKRTDVEKCAWEEKTGRVYTGVWHNSPQDSWVANEVIEAAQIGAEMSVLSKS